MKDITGCFLHNRIRTPRPLNVPITFSKNGQISINKHRNEIAVKWQGANVYIMAVLLFFKYS